MRKRLRSFGKLLNSKYNPKHITVTESTDHLDRAHVASLLLADSALALRVAGNWKNTALGVYGWLHRKRTGPDRRGAELQKFQEAVGPACPPAQSGVSPAQPAFVNRLPALRSDSGVQGFAIRNVV